MKFGIKIYTQKRCGTVVYLIGNKDMTVKEASPFFVVYM